MLCECVPDQERYVLCRGLNGTAASSSISQERAPALGFEADEPTEVMDLWLLYAFRHYCQPTPVPLMYQLSCASHSVRTLYNCHFFKICMYMLWSLRVYLGDRYVQLCNSPIILGYFLLEIESFSLHPYSPDPLKTELSVQVWLRLKIQPIVMVHTSIPNTRKTKVVGSWFKASLSLNIRKQRWH